jgi:hypothetical protein
MTGKGKIGKGKPYTRDPFGGMRQLYEETENPVYVWHVIAMLAFGNRENKIVLPDWVLDYLGEAAQEIMRLTYLAVREKKPPNNETVRESLARALGFTSVRGVPAAVGKYGKRTRYLTLGTAVAARLHNKTSRNLTEAYDDVAAYFEAAWGWDVSSRTVQRAYQDYMEAAKQ